MVELHLAKVDVAGSSPVSRSFNGPLAQLVEQQTLNLWVKGSKPLRLISILCESGEIGIHASLRN